MQQKVKIIGGIQFNSMCSGIFDKEGEMAFGAKFGLEAMTSYLNSQYSDAKSVKNRSPKCGI